MIGNFLGGLTNNKTIMSGIGTFVSALLGGKQTSARRAVGGGGLALLASLAASALKKAGQTQSDAPKALFDPQTADEKLVQQFDAQIIIQAMVNAAKADGEVGKVELQKIVGKLKKDGLTSKGKKFLMGEINKPSDLSGAVSMAGHSPQMAAQIYAASFLAIEVDTVAEQAYMKQLAAGLGLHPEVANHIERTLGI